MMECICCGFKIKESESIFWDLCINCLKKNYKLGGQGK